MLFMLYICRIKIKFSYLILSYNALLQKKSCICTKWRALEMNISHYSDHAMTELNAIEARSF